MSYSVEAYLAGRDDAERDIAEGRLVIEIFVAPWSPDRGESILKERYGIELKIVGTDLVFTGEREHAEGYNELMETEIERRFGPGILEKAAAEAEAQGNSERPPPQPAWKTLIYVLLVGPPVLLACVVLRLIMQLMELPRSVRAQIERLNKL
jgi:hypothetical protein